jgi:hypothetical protein
VTYNVNYLDYAIRGADADETYNVLFYFADKSAYAVYSFSVIAAEGTDPDPESEDSDVCESVTLEQVGTAVAGMIHVKVYGRGLTNMGTSSGEVPTIVGTPSVEKITESISIAYGVGSTSKPVNGAVTVISASRAVSNVQTTRNTKEIIIPNFVNLPSIPITIAYTSIVVIYRFVLSSSYKEPTLTFWGTPYGIGRAACSTPVVLSMSIPSNPGGGETPSSSRLDITINITDYVSGVNLDGASVWIDGSYEGQTDTNGLLNVANVPVGDHTIKITKPGFQDSDQDNLANDTFTVS